jgi:hypothetical protein
MEPLVLGRILLAFEGVKFRSRLLIGGVKATNRVELVQFKVIAPQGMSSHIFHFTCIGRPGRKIRTEIFLGS